MTRCFSTTFVWFWSRKNPLDTSRCSVWVLLRQTMRLWMSVTKEDWRLISNEGYLKAVVTVFASVSVFAASMHFLLSSDLIPWLWARGKECGCSSFCHSPTYQTHIKQRFSFFQSVCWHSQYCTTGRLLLLTSVPHKIKITVTVDVRIYSRFNVKTLPLSHPFAVFPFGSV